MAEKKHEYGENLRKKQELFWKRQRKAWSMKKKRLGEKRLSVEKNAFNTEKKACKKAWYKERKNGPEKKHVEWRKNAE